MNPLFLKSGEAAGKACGVKIFNVARLWAGGEFAADFFHFKEMGETSQPVDGGVFSDLSDDFNLEAGLFLHFPAGGSFGRLARIDSSTGQNPYGNISALD